MSEKRFQLNMMTIPHRIEDDGKVMELYDVVVMLNSLIKEVKDVRRWNNHYACKYYEFKKENEELKEENRELRQQLKEKQEDVKGELVIR